MLGGLLPPVVAHLVAETGEFAAKMGEAEALTKRVTGASGASWAQAGKAAMGVGAVMAAAAGTVAVETIKMASDFNTQMERVHTQAGASQREVDSLKSKVLDLAAATGQGPEALAEALYHVESVGYRGATAMAVLDNASKLASISGANLDDTTYGLTSVMQTYGAKAQDAAHWASFFNAVVGAGDMRMEDFNKSVGTGFFSAAQTFGISAQSAGAALAFMTDRGQSAEVAATNLRMSVALLAAPSQKATKILTGLGLTSEDVARSHVRINGVLKKSQVTYSQLADDLRKPDGFVVALSHLKKGLEDSGLSADAANAQLSHAFGGGKSDSTILAMLNNLGTLKSKYDAVGKGMGSFAESYKASAETAAGQMARLKASAQGLGIEIGNALMPYFVAFLGWVKTGTDWMRTHEGAVKAIAMLIGVTLVSGLALATAGAIAFAIATSEVWVPIFLIIMGVMALVAGLMLLVTHWRQVWGWIVSIAKDVGSWLAQTWRAISADASQIWGAMVGWVQQQWNKLASWFSSAWHFVTDPIVRGWHSLQDTTTRIWNGITAWFKKWWPLLFVIFFPAIAALIYAWNHFHQQVEDKVREVWDWVTSHLKAVWKAITAVAKAEWDLFYTSVVAPVQRAAHAVGDWLSWLWGRVKFYFGLALGVARAIWNGFYAVTVQPVINAAIAVGTWMSNIGNSVHDGFWHIIDQVRALWNEFWSIGGFIMQGLWSGITSWFGTIENGVGNFLNGMLGWAKSILGIHSPSKVFADEIGQWIPKGVAVGIDLHAHAATDSVSGLAAKMRAAGRVAMASGSPSMQLSSSALTAVSASSMSTVHATVHVVAQVDGKVLFETQQERALQYQRRNSAPAFTH